MSKTYSPDGKAKGTWTMRQIARQLKLKQVAWEKDFATLGDSPKLRFLDGLLPRRGENLRSF